MVKIQANRDAGRRDVTRRDSVPQDFGNVHYARFIESDCFTRDGGRGARARDEKMSRKTRIRFLYSYAVSSIRSANFYTNFAGTRIDAR